MATRENFLIECSTGETAIRHTWNSACRQVETMIREIAERETATYSLEFSESRKKGFYHVDGVREWRGDNGKTVRFVIAKQA